MTFEEKFRENYRVALHAARANDKEATINGLNGLYRLFSEQYSLRNGDSIATKAKLTYWQDIFNAYSEIIRKYGLSDKRVRKFFGLIEDDALPSLGDFMKGKGDVKDISDDKGKYDTEEDKKTDNSPEIDIEGLGGESEEKEEEPAPAAEDKIPEPVPEDEYYGAESEESSGTEKSFKPTSLEGFIGQNHIVKPLLKEIAIAKAQGRKYLDNILLLGNPGLGKTTLMELIAKSLGVKFEWMDCSQYRNSQQSLKALQNFLLKVASDGEPVVIAFDEIHMLTDELQSSLLTLLNSRVYVSPPDVNGIVKRIPIDNFTFIAATTDDDKVLNTIKDRCLRLKFQMVDYTKEELRLIYRNKAEAKGLTISDEAIDMCIPRSRGSIRYVNSFVDGLDTALYDDFGQRVSFNVDTELVKKFFEDKKIDAIGLTDKDLEILRAIQEDISGSMGAETLSARVGLDPKKYLSEYEPYLIKIGFITISGRGRSLTEKAMKHLKGEN